MLKEFRGHTSFVNGALYSADGTRIISCSADSTVRVWDSRSCDCTFVMRCVDAWCVGRGEGCACV